ncbi:MAG: BON domain-containing protein [Planctomycetia bacterium]|nr:BON domain-containing protein [Planctomycetia bacterium]
MNLRVSDRAEAASEFSFATDGNARLAEQVELALRATGYPPLRNIHVAAFASGVQLHGTVPTYHLKQLAQAAALGVAGIRTVVNDLDVVSMR